MRESLSFFRRRSVWAAVAGVLAVVGVAAAEWRWSESAEIAKGLLGLTVADVRAFVEAWGPWGAAASILLMIVHSFLPFPGEVIAIANGMVFGTPLGLAITWTGAMLGAVLSFGLARRLGRPVGRRLVSAEHWRRIELWRGDSWTLVMVRLIPVISFNLINYAAGVTGVGWWRFVWTTGIGILPITLASVIMGNLLLEVSWPLWIAIAAAVVVIWLVGKRVMERLPRASWFDGDRHDPA